MWRSGLALRLSGLLAALLLLLGLAAGLALHRLQQTTGAVATVYQDRVVPLYQLRLVADAYARQVPAVLTRVHRGELLAPAAHRALADLRGRIAGQWQAYLGTRLTTQEAALIAETEPARQRADAAFDRLQVLLAAGDITTLEGIAPGELLPALEGAADAADRLADLQLTEARAEFTRSEQGLRDVAWAIAGLTLLAVAGGVFGVRALVRSDRAAHAAKAERLQRLDRFYLALSRTSQLITRERDERKLFEGICQLCVDTGHARRATISLREGRHSRRVVAAGPSESFFSEGGDDTLDLDSPEGQRTVTARVLREGRSEVLADYPAAQPVARWRDRAIAQQLYSVAVFPLRRGGEVIGTFAVGAGERDYFDPPLVHLLEEMVSDLSFALDNLDRDRAQQEADRRAARLSSFLAALSQTGRLIVRERDERRLFDAVCRICVETAGVLHAGIVAFEGGEVTRLTAAGAASEVWQRMPERWRPDDPAAPPFLTSIALREGQPIVSNDYLNEPRIGWVAGRARHYGVRAAAVFPLRRDGRVCGALQVFAAEVGFFDDDRVALLQELAADLSLALDQKARSEAEAASRAKSEFLARMSHELRTPLNAVLGFSQLLLADDAERLSATQRDQIEHVRRAGWHLLALINDVLDVTRIESGQLRVESQPVALAPLLDEALRMAGPVAAPLAVTLAPAALEPADVQVQADPLRLRQVVINVLSNAAKYNRPGGSVRTTAWADPADDSAVIEVADNGLGMTREQLAHLFEPFNRLGRERGGIEGTGIGLALTHQLVRLMNGRFSVDSEVGRGTTVRITLPAARRGPAAAAPVSAPAAAVPAADAPAASVPASASRDASVLAGGGADDPSDAGPCGVVLYIEDNPVNLLLVEQLLARWPSVRLAQAENGRSGLELARSLRPDLVLLDMQLPDINGLAVLQALQGDPATRALPVVALSASAMAEDVQRARAAGAVDYWTKPLVFEHFLADVRRLLSDAHITR